jgi:FtsP/CotA-like multicopper oxidase with cupredoxin domain
VLGGAVALAGAGGLATWATYGRQGTVTVDPLAIEAVEATRRRSGRAVAVALTPQRAQVDLGGRLVSALTYGGQLPGQLVRVSAGDLLRVRLRNALDQATSVHWHGLAIRNDADGVPGVTSPEVAPGTSADLEFVVPDPGTYWFHPHSGLQLDWGLYAPLIVDDPGEPGDYDHELVVLLDDWSPGLGRTPEQLLADLRAGGGAGSMPGMGGMDHAGMGAGMMSDAGDVDYPAYLANGRLPAASTSLAAKPGQRVRLRLINAAADTTFDVAVARHRLSVTHSDGFPVAPVAVDVIRVSMGERYDATVVLDDGVFPLVAVPVGKPGTPARVLLRSGAGQAPSPDLLPDELRGRRLRLDDLTAGDAVALPAERPDSVQDVVLGGGMTSYRWTINGRSYDDVQPLSVRRGELTRLRLANRTMMLHPVHLHGHTFAVRRPGDAGRGARKDTVLVPAMASLAVDVRADNPGAWMLHCHNAFHMEAGMMTRLDYRT